MAQPNNTTNWVIQGTNGQPQMIKLVQPAGKTMSGIMTSTVAGQQVKIFKSPNQEGGVQVFSATGSSPQVIRTITTTPRYVTTKVTGITNKTTGTKTIRLTPSQVQNIKFVSPQSTQKIQSASSTMPVIHAHSPQTTKNASPPILVRKRADPLDVEYLPESKRMRKEKVGKGLRHFSMKVCEKVRKKGKTTYNEVADELVGEFTNATSNNSLADQQYDQKNIRRRVYDALNVLMAMNIISKEKKEIRWIGLPTNSLQECMQLEREKSKKMAIIKEKRKKLNDLVLNQVSFKNLVKRNKEAEMESGPPPPNSYVQLPFLIISTKKKTEVDCSISTDKREYVFQFNDKFAIIDDADVLKSIKMLKGLDTGKCSEEDLAEMRATVPESLQEYVTQIAFKLHDDIDNILEAEEPGTSRMLSNEDLVEATLDENSHQSSSDPLSPPSAQDYSDDENESDELSNSDIELSGA